MAQGQRLIRDVIVVLPGIMGSTLAKGDKLVWAPSAGAVLKAIRTFGDSVRELTLPLGIGDDAPRDGVRPVGLMPDMHLLPGVWSWNIGYGVLLDWLRRRFHTVEASPSDPERIPNLLPIPYDWRLSNRHNGRRVKGIVEPALARWRAQGGEFAEAKLIFICHSMGGLVARWYIDREGGAAVTRKLITLGTPHRGALKAVDQLVNGVKEGIGPLSFDLTAFARSLPSVHQLLPEYACIEGVGGVRGKITEAALPVLDAGMVADAMRFHGELDAAMGAGYDLHPIVGTRQNTLATARIVGGRVACLETIDGEDEGGDGTVPRFAATPLSLRPDSPGIHYVADQHGGLQSNGAVLDEIEGILTARPVVYRGATGLELGVKVEPIVLDGERIAVEARLSGDASIALQARVFDEAGRAVGYPLGLARSADGVYRVTLDPLPPGAHRIVVGGVGAMAAQVAPVGVTVLVWGAA